MSSFSNRAFLAVVAASAAMLGQAQGPVFAQSGEEEIIVTATKRDSRLQDVPVAVTPVTAELIENSGIRDLQDLTSVAAALQFNVSENETSATARLRGIGTQGSNPGLESAVGIFVDGVYRARNGVALTDLGDITQIEVLRGPQGTLFGRNTSAGLITVTTAGPDLNDVLANGELTYGDYNELRAAGGVSAPLIEDRLAVRVFGAIAQRDGFLEVQDAQGRVSDVNNRDVWTVRGQLAWEPTDDIAVRLIADYSERDEECCAAKIYNPTAYNGATTVIGPGPARASIPVQFPASASLVTASLGGFGPNGVAALTAGNGDIESEDDRFGFANRTYDQVLEDWGVSGQVDWDFGGVTLTAITAYRDWSYGQGQDSDFSAADIIFRDVDTGNGFSFEVFTQELRVSGVRGPVDWLVGAFFADETLKRVDRFGIGTQYQDFFRANLTGALTPTLGATTAGAVAAAGTGPLAAAEGTIYDDRYTQDGQSIALFTHNIIALGDRTDLTIGLRYTQDEKDLTGTFSTPFAGLARPDVAGTIAALPAALQPTFRGVYATPWFRNSLDAVGYDQSREENEWSGVVSLRRDLTEAVSAYVSASRGYKSGGFNLDRDFSFLTAGGAPSSDFEAEFVDAYEIGLKNRLFGGALLLNFAAFANEFKDFQLNRFDGLQFVVTSVPEVTSQGFEVDAIWNTPMDGLTFQSGVAYAEAEYGPDTGWAVGDLNVLPGSRLTNAPLWTATSAATYRRLLLNDNLEGLVHVDVRYESDQNTGSGLQSVWVRPENILVNARLGVARADGRLGLEVWSRNLLDETTGQIMFNQPLQTGAYGAFLNDPRTYGVTVKARY